MIPYGAGINSALAIGADIGVSPEKATWIAAAYPYVLQSFYTHLPTYIYVRLTQGAFVIMGGTVGAVYGHKNTVVLAGMWWVIFHVVSGFIRDLIAF